MKKEIVVLDSDCRQSRGLCEFLVGQHFTAVEMNKMVDLEPYLRASDCRAVILNLDNIRVTNQALRELKRKKPDASIIVLSERQFHPELEEAFRDYISVCLKQPLDPDELVYWLRSIFENNDVPKANSC